MTAHATAGAEVDLPTSSENQGLSPNAAIAHVRTENGWLTQLRLGITTG